MHSGQLPSIPWLIPHSPTAVIWGHLPNKLFALGSLFQDLFLEELDDNTRNRGPREAASWVVAHSAGQGLGSSSGKVLDGAVTPRGRPLAADCLSSPLWLS